MHFPAGWHSAATLVDDRWVDRQPRQPEAAEQLRRQTRLLPWLAPRLPLPIPEPQVRSETPLVVRHELVPGKPLTEPDAAQGHQLGVFLRALHDIPVDEAVDHGLRPAHEEAEEHAETMADFRARVVPLVPAKDRAGAVALLDALREPPGNTVVHGDLGPDHVLTHEGTLTGIIDFGAAHVGDPAIDLAWALHGTPAAFAEALATAYRVTEEQYERAPDWHRLGPWYEVVHGLDTDAPDTVRSGLAGVVSRLPYVSSWSALAGRRV